MVIAGSSQPLIHLLVPLKHLLLELCYIVKENGLQVVLSTWYINNL